MHSFFYMRKPPGLRLRFDVRRASRGALVGAVDVLLANLRERRVVGRAWWSPYEPEVFLFGGAGVIDAVHTYFDCDSSVALRWDALEARGGTTVSVDVLSLCVLNDLFFRATAGAEEAWDVWHNVSEAHGRAPADESGKIPALSIPDIAPRVSPAERRMLSSYARANRALVRALNRLERAGLLTSGRRAVLPFLAQWHWNRYGFDSARRARIYNAMTASLDPRANMRGTRP